MSQKTKKTTKRDNLRSIPPPRKSSGRAGVVDRPAGAGSNNPVQGRREAPNDSEFAQRAQVSHLTLTKPDVPETAGSSKRCAKYGLDASNKTAAAMLARGFTFDRIPNLTLMSGPNGVPSHRRTGLRFAQRVALSASFGVIGNFTWVLNGPYDPGYTSGSTQPAYFVQFAQQYSRYTVHSANVKFVVIDNSASVGAAQIEFAYGPHFVTNELSSLPPEAVGTVTGGHWQLINFHEGSGTLSNTMETSYSIPGHMGVHPSTVFAYPYYGVSASSNPVTPFYLTVAYQAVDEATSLSNVYLYCEIDFDVTFFMPNAETMV